MPVQSPNNYNLYMNTGIVNSHSGLSYNYDPSDVNNAERLKENQCIGEFTLPTLSAQNQNYNAPFTLMQDNFQATDTKIEHTHNSDTINHSFVANYAENISHYNTNANIGQEPGIPDSNQISNKTLAQPLDGLVHNQAPESTAFAQISKVDITSKSPNKVSHSLTFGKRAIISSESEDDEPLSAKLNKLSKTNDDDEPLTLKLNKLAAKNKIKKEIGVSPKTPSTNKDTSKVNNADKKPVFEKSESKNGLVSKVHSSNDTKKKEMKLNHTQSSTTKIKSEFNDSISNSGSVKKKKSKGDNKEVKKEEDNVWKWWEEESREDGVKWNTLEHRGPVFAPKYVVLPEDVLFKYDGKVVKLSPQAEEVAGFYAKMLDHEYVTKQQFKDNFFKDWRKVMTKEEKALITDLDKCDFLMMAEHFKKVSEERKNMSKEDKLRIKQEQEEIQKEYGYCILDGRPQKIGNYKIEPPSLFRGRGDHPKMGKLKKRIEPEDVIINCGKHGKIPQPPAGHKWKEVRHDNTVTWLASWTENVQQSIKYIMLNPSSKLKGEKDWMKYETARRLKTCVDKIRQKYREDWKSKVMLDRQRGVALYFIDKLALRAGNEKEEGETADTVGCCSLRVEHVKLHEKLAGEEYVIEFDFLGKDCIRYQNNVPVEKRVFKNIQLFMQNKKSGDDLFDRLTTQILNKHLNEQMEGLTAKVFRTFNASMTLQDQLNKLTTENSSMHEKLLAYNRANRAVAILCNHQRTIPKAHGKQMENLQDKAKAKKEAIAEAKHEAKVAKAELKKDNNPKNLANYEKKKLKLKRLQEQLLKLDLQATDKEENKSIALGTSKLNYLDPRITVAWCKKNDINVTKLYNKTQREKFLWAIEMATPDFVF